MYAYMARRLLAAIPVIVVVAAFVFLLLHISPGDPAAIIAGDNANTQQVAAIRAALGLDRPLLVVWGDFIDKHAVWPKIRPNPEKCAAAIKAAGGTVDTFDLPAMGIKGNTHMLMMDKNSDAVAEVIQKWFVAKGFAD